MWCPAGWGRGPIRPHVLGGDSDGPSALTRTVASTAVRSLHRPEWTLRVATGMTRERSLQGAGALDSPAVATPTGDAHLWPDPFQQTGDRIRALPLRDFFAGAAARAVPAVWTG